MFKKRNFRKKPADEGENDGEGEESSVVPPSTQPVPSEKPAKAKLKKNLSSAGLLSFEEEEEEGPALMLPKSSKETLKAKSEFKSKKDRAKQKEQVRNTDKDEDKSSTQRPQAGMYTQEMLQQLRSETKTIGGGS
eukprot:2433989-Pyramimonas_sp.AAC.2